MNKKYIVCIGAVMAVLLSLCQCSSNESNELEGYGHRYPMTKEIFNVIDSCMGYMNSDPAKSHSMIDSLSKAGVLSPQRSGYMHATVLFGGEDNADSALALCNSLLDEKEFGDDVFIEEEICELASNISISLRRYFETLKYANRGIQLCHGNERMQSDEAKLTVRVGFAEQKSGHVEKAQEAYGKAYELLKDDNTFGGLIAILSLKKKQASLYSMMHEYDKTIATCREVLSLVGQFDRNPSFVEQRPETMKESGSATREFADMYECQMYCRIANAYRMKMELGLSEDAHADMDSLNTYLDLWSMTDNSNSPANLANSLPELYFAGRKAAFAEAKDAVAELFRSDSLINDYVEYLTLLAKDAASNHDYLQSSKLLSRALVVSDSIRQRDAINALSEQMSINMVQEEKLARQDAEHQLAQHKWIIVLLSVLLVVIAVAALVISLLVRRNLRNKEIIEMAQQDLTETKEEMVELVQQLQEAKQLKVENNAQALYERIEQAMKEKKLYLNSNLDIKMLAEEIGSNRTIISICVNSVTGKSFRQWVSEYRLSLFVQLLKEKPETSIEDLMVMCGYKEQSTFRRQFKATYGMTAGEYRRQILEAK